MTGKEKKDRHLINTKSARTMLFIDSIFTITALIIFVMGLIQSFWNYNSGAIKMILGLAFWIASTQLQPYWDRYAPTRCAHQPEDPDNEIQRPT